MTAATEGQSNNTTRCARLTAAGRGAIAVVALRGVGAVEMVDRLFQPFNKKPYTQCSGRRLVYGVWQSTGEDVVVYDRTSLAAVARLRETNPSRAQHQTTPSLEIHCHGGSAAVNSILDALAAAGVEVVAADKLAQTEADCEWTQEILSLLPLATTQRTASYLLSQLQCLPAAVAKIHTLIDAGDRTAAIAAIDQILKWSDFGLSLTQLPSVVLCGQPNVGKSSLINAIVGFQRAIVHDTPGTTRDVVTQQTAVAGWPIELKDTAGLREAGGEIEQMGIENARRQIEAAKVVIGVFDASMPWSDQDRALLELLNPALVVHNKSDLQVNNPERPSGVSTSANTSFGLDDLISAIATKLVPALPPVDAAYCISPRQIERLNQMRAAIAM